MGKGINLNELGMAGFSNTSGPISSGVFFPNLPLSQAYLGGGGVWI